MICENDQCVPVVSRSCATSGRYRFFACATRLPAVCVTHSYQGNVDHGQMEERESPGVYCIVTKGKQFEEFKFHLRWKKKDVETVVGSLPKKPEPLIVFINSK